MSTSRESHERFDLIAELARGAMASVFLARWDDARLVEFRRLHREPPPTGVRTVPFLAEVVLALQIQHPNVVRTLEAGTNADGDYLITEHLEGETLARLRGESNPLPLHVAVRIVLDALAGLAAVHELAGDGQPADMLGRDLGAETVQVGLDGVARLSGVGVARRAIHPAPASDRGAGEAHRRGELCRRTDVFAMGVALWEAVASRGLRLEDDEGALLGHRARAPIPRLDAVRGDVPAGLADVCARALASDPADRFAGAAAFARALEAAAGDADLLGDHAEVAAHLEAAIGAGLVNQRAAVQTLMSRRASGRGFPRGSAPVLPQLLGPSPDPEASIPTPVPVALGTGSPSALVAGPPVGAPDRFGKYVVTRHLANGGMAEVYLACSSGIEGFAKNVVVKRLKPELATSETATRLFLQEARLAATLDHPQIAQVYDVGVVDGSYFYAMEHVDGEDLRRVMRAAIRRGRPLRLADSLRIVTELCGALHHAHEKHGPDGAPLGLVHRDVSPSNVLISYDGAVKLCDFGVAEVAASRADPARRTHVGKLSYMSPEQCRGDALDRRSDLFVLAIVLYEMTTLTKLFKGKDERDVTRQIVSGAVRPPTSVRPDYPPELERIVLRGLSVDPAARYSTAQEIRLDLEAFGREHKLALSALGLSQLMGNLFPPDQRGSSDTEIHVISDFGPTPRVASAAPRPWHRLALVAAIAAAALALASLAIAPSAGGPTAEQAAQLRASGERIAGRLDARLRGSRIRADGIATLPMLRAAISTDAATMHDMARRESLFAAAEGETIEFFRWRGARATSLLRVPPTGQAVAPIKGAATHLAPFDRGLVVSASARLTPLYADDKDEGSVVITTVIDRDELARELPDGLASAAIRGLTADVELVASSAASAAAPARTAATTVGLPLDPAWGAPALTLEIDLVAPTGRAWLPAARRVSLGCSIAFAGLFLVGRRRHRPWRKRS